MAGFTTHGQKRSYWMWKIPLTGQLAFATWHLKSFRHTHIYEIIFTHNKHKSSTHTHTRTHIYTLALIRRRSEPSTAQFRNFYGKSSLIKFNELWKRQQISRVGQLCCKLCPRWYFLWVDVRRQASATALSRLLQAPPVSSFSFLQLTHSSVVSSAKPKVHRTGASICLDSSLSFHPCPLVNWRMWFLWVWLAALLNAA